MAQWKRLLGIPILLVMALASACSDDELGPILCNDQNPCTTDSLGPDGCVNLPAAGIPCESSEPCSPPGTCNEDGFCIASAPACDDDNDCTSDVCMVDEAGGGACVHSDLADGAACDDDSACTTNDVCSSGACGGTVVDTDDHEPCTIDTCDPAAGVQHAPVADGTSCGGADVCVGLGSCQSGMCQQQAPLDCDDEDACTTDTCVPGVGCQHGAVVCSDGSACTIDACDPQLGCTFTEVDCSDGDACTTDSCDDTQGCQHAAVKCDDDDLCTTDSCDVMSGCVHVSVTCDDGNFCTSDACDSDTGSCQFTPVANQACDDGDLCTEDDRCDAEGACGGQEVDLDDGSFCTADACDSVEGVSHVPLEAGTPCGDGAGLVPFVCNDSGACVSVPYSESVVARVGGQDPDVDERRLGSGRHPVAASEEGLGVTFYEVTSAGAVRAAVAAFSPTGDGRGLWRVGVSSYEPSPVLAAVPGGGFVVAYQDTLAEGDATDVVLVRLDASGAQLSSPQIANDTTQYGQHSPDVVWQDDRLWVAWEDDAALLSQGARRICVRSFTEDLVPLTDESCDDEAGVNRGAVAWASTASGQARAWRRETGGAGSVEVEWNGWQHLFPYDALPDEGELPALLAVDVSHVALVYTDGIGDQWAAVMDDAGAMFGPWLVNASPAALRFEPSVARTDDGIYVAWREPADAGASWTELLDETYIQKLTWDGAAWTEAEPAWPLPHDMLFAEGDQRRPALAGTPLAPSGAIWAAWEDLAEGQEGPEHGDVRVSLMPTPIVRIPEEN